MWYKMEISSTLGVSGNKPDDRLTFDSRLLNSCGPYYFIRDFPKNKLSFLLFFFLGGFKTLMGI